MAVPEALIYQPHGNNMMTAFTWPNDRHLAIGNTRERILRANKEKIARAASDYFTTGVAYFANHGHDAYMKDVGTVSWWTVNQMRALPLFTDNMKAATAALNVNPDLVKSEKEPHVFYGASRNGKEIVDIAYVLLPPEFILTAKQHPIKGLGSMAWMGSQIRDMANGRIMIDPQFIKPRALATEAHFLHEAVEQHPNLVLDPYHLQIMEAFPDGIRSLPPQARYRGVTGTEFRFAGLN